MAGPACTRPPEPSTRRRFRDVVTVLAILAGGLLVSAPAFAQQGALIPFPPVPPRPPASKMAGQEQMLVRANQINYDNANRLIAAVGNVQIYFRGATLEADKVIYDQTTKRLHAEGNVHLTEPNGDVTTSQIMDLSDDYRDGFVDALHVDTADMTYIAAPRGERTAGRFNVFHNGVYTACLPCKDDPKKPPEWQVKAKRIVHDQNEKMIYFEDASLEFWGLPIAYLPYFSAPDPTVKRKTGFLMPSFSTAKTYGFGIEIPYYFALAPDYDVTIAPKITTRQGPLMQAEFRQRLMNGAYEIRAAGIDQLDKNAFAGTFGDRQTRGSVESDGKFALNERWTWGWDAVLLSDRYFLADYNPSLSKYYRTADNLLSLTTEAPSQLFITGKGDRSYFDARSIYYLGLSGVDVQSQIPVIYPVIDYTYTVAHPVFNGELSYNTNFTNLTRNQANFEAITQAAFIGGTCNQTADPALLNHNNCVLRGIPGTYSRFSTEANWRRSITDSIGQVFTPFASVRADAAAMDIKSDPGVSNFINTGGSDLVRAMPTVGLEYRYPFISVQSWGTQTFEPIAQVIARPNEPQVGQWPTEDAQSLIFDDSNLFRVDKFTGWDRIEGGGRTNYGAQYTMQFNQGGSINALFGQSYQLFGQNSFANTNSTTNTGLDSGLDTRLSDYVARVTYQPNPVYAFSTRFRFDNNTFNVQRAELEATANFDRWSGRVLYGDYAAQPAIGFLNRRQGVLGSGTIKLDANWVLTGGALYDLEAKKIVQNQIGLGYVDDCVSLLVSYVTTYAYNSGSVTNNNMIMLSLTLRTIGTAATSTSVSSLTGANTPLGLGL